MRADTREVAWPPGFQREGNTVSSPVHSPANTASRLCSSCGFGAVRRSSAMSASLDGFHDLLRGIVEIIGRQHVETGFADDRLALFHIGAFEPHDQRYLQADFLDGGDNALGDDIAFRDPAEDVDEDA